MGSKYGLESGGLSEWIFTARNCVATPGLYIKVCHERSVRLERTDLGARCDSLAGDMRANGARPGQRSTAHGRLYRP